MLDADDPSPTPPSHHSAPRRLPGSGTAAPASDRRPTGSTPYCRIAQPRSRNAPVNTTAAFGSTI
ncbi:hypothetical protein, partial [Streptomyces scabiei]|uniref:hypothetical protein n=1 Tax=Streptomyces scabiei TaxID=1930 RepID=UPI0038F6A277